MYLFQSVNTDFVLVDTEWPVGKALKLVNNLGPKRVIVQCFCGEYEKFYYLYDKDKFVCQVENSTPEILLRKVLDMHEGNAMAAVPDATSEADAPNVAVVMSGDRVIGYWESHLERGGLLVERSLMARFPRTVPLNEERDLRVSLTGINDGKPFKVPVGAKVDIKVEAKRGFDLVGSDRDQLAVTGDGDNPETASLTFRLKATDIGTGEIQVWASFQGIDLAGVSITPRVEAGPLIKESIVQSHAPFVEPASRYPDLFLKISEQWKNGNRGFTMEVHGPQFKVYMQDYGFIPFARDPGNYFEEFYKDIESFQMETAQDRVHALEKLKSKGNHLSEVLLPPELRERLWSLRKSIGSIFIHSDEPWIPWELCRLSGKVNGIIEEGDFWCEAFALTRWIRSIDHQAIKVSEDLTLNRIATVVPDNSGLAYAEQEKKYLLSLRNGERTVKEIRARFVETLRALESGIYDGWHFTGHGGACLPNPDLSVIQLEDEPLKPENLSGKVKNLGSRCNPLVFLNACQIGRGGMSLTGIGGWASRFLAAGAGAFIGPLWSVYDSSACAFAKKLYGELIKGSPIGEAVRAARWEIKEAGDPTWLAYTVFAYPMAAVKP